MQNKLKRFLILSVVWVFLSACGTDAERTTPTLRPDTVLTAAAQTANARLTELAKPIPTETMAPTPIQTETLPEAMPSAVVTATFEQLVTATATLGGTSTGTNQAEYVADITVPDGSDFHPGDSFTKVWRLRNAGSATWTTGYALVFIGGSQMDGPDSISLTQEVPPGDTVDLGVDLVAPPTAGTYRGFWEMRSAAGELFTTAVYVEIDVITGTPGVEATSPPSSEARVTNASISVDNASPDECPYSFIFTANFTLSKGTMVTYQMEAGTDTPGFVFTLPGPVSNDFSAGNHTLTYTLDISDSVVGWAQLYISSPNEVRSNQVNFSLDCSK
jgi:hypothetical protein